jgi:hypothetical protein
MSQKERSHVLVRRYGKYLELWLYRFILFRSRGFVPGGWEVSDANRAKWVSSFVRCSTGGTFQGIVGAGPSSAIGRDRTEVVFSAVVLYADGASGFLRFAELGVVAVTLPIAAVGVRGPGEVFRNSTYAVPDSEMGYTKMCQVNSAMEGDYDSGGAFVEAALSWDKPAGFLNESQGWVSSFNFASDTF